MSILGLRLNGVIGSANGGSPPATTDWTPFSYVVGNPGQPIAGTNVFTISDLSSGLVNIFYNNNTLTLNVDFTVNYSTKEVTLLTGNLVNGDTLTGSYKSA